VLVCGPPCAGKSTRVRQAAAPGDVVVDLDEIAHRLDPSVDRHDHGSVVRGLARHERDALERAVGRMTDGTAWVIRAGGGGESARGRLARKVKATEVEVLDPGRTEVERRARADGRPDGTMEAIARWYDGG